MFLVFIQFLVVDGDKKSGPSFSLPALGVPCACVCVCLHVYMPLCVCSYTRVCSYVCGVHIPFVSGGLGKVDIGQCLQLLLTVLF